MAAVRRGRKGYFLRKRSREQSRPRKSPIRRRKLLPRPRRSPRGILRLPSSGSSTKCPLMSWSFSRWMQSHVFLPPKARRAAGPSRGDTSCKMLLRAHREKQQHIVRTCTDFLKNAHKAVVGKKRPKWAAASAKGRRRYSDEEIFYRLASFPKDNCAATVSGPTCSSAAPLPPTAGELQQVSC